MKSIGSCQSPCNAAVGEERGGLEVQQVALFTGLYRLAPSRLLNTGVRSHRRCPATRPAVDPKSPFAFEMWSRRVLASDNHAQRRKPHCLGPKPSGLSRSPRKPGPPVALAFSWDQ